MKNPPISSSFIMNLSAETIKLGVDAHLDRYVVAIKVDESAPLRPRRFNLDQLLAFIGGAEEGVNVHISYLAQEFSASRKTGGQSRI